MISIYKEKKHDCTGCFACVLKCPKACISMVEDEEGFCYPFVNQHLCVNCHLCEESCPILTPTRKKANECPLAYAAYSKDVKTREQSSSGGIFTNLAELIISQGGVVFGAAFQSDFSVAHIYVDCIEDLHKLRGSKYLQSVIGNSYKDAKNFLEQGRQVYFSGTPCQIEGLYSFLGKEYSNLYTQDIICHGVPSPKVWQKYVKFREKKAASSTRRIFFRHKKYGWKMFSTQFKFSNCTEYIQDHFTDLYMTSFLKNWCLRPSCYECHFKKINRLSDITLGDFWGVQNVCPEMDDDMGTSLVIVNSNKGNELFHTIDEKTVSQKISIADGIKYNSAMTTSPKCPKERKIFLSKVSSENFEKIVYSMNRKSFYSRILIFFKRVKRFTIRKIKLLIGE